MAGRRIIYALTWIGCFVFFLAYRGWISWLILTAVTALPLFSLLISLPAMLTARLELPLPDAVDKGTPVILQPQCVCSIPVIFHKCSVVVTNPMTGLRRKQKAGSALPTDHCGALCCKVTRAGVCDYLRLFRLPLRRCKPVTILVRPTPYPMESAPDPELHTEGFWKPKTGGGFSENHELRLYRPGDSVQQIHWKLSAKTGKLILREPMLLQHKPISVGLELHGDGQSLDRKLGRLLWLGTDLVNKDLPFVLHCIHDGGTECWHLTTQQALEQAIDAILVCTPLSSPPPAGHWQYRIGGEPDET